MNASFAEVFRGGERSTLDAPVAALAGLSVAFLAFAAPADILADLVSSTGLSSVIPAAEPPLGMKARFGLGAAGAVGVFAIVFLLLRWLDRVGTPRPRPQAAADEMEAPRLRRRDIHPDAPSRAPLLAGLELGEPIAQEPDPVPPLPKADAGPDEPAPFSSESEAEAPVVPEPRRAPAPAAACEASEAIPDLMKRLEQGLARRRTAVEPTQITDPPAFENEPVNDRLQSAIENLQRLASSQN